jgi:hypothetical protein
MAANKIVAQPATIAGSIGVLGGNGNPVASGSALVLGLDKQALRRVPCNPRATESQLFTPAHADVWACGGVHHGTEAGGDLQHRC